MTAAPVGSSSFPGDNGKIAFASDRTGNSEIFVMNPDGSNQTNLTNASEEDASPNWSADGEKIAFDREQDIFVMNPDGSGQAQLTNDPALDVQPSWSPNGKKIAFASDRTTNFDIFVMNVNGSGLTQLTNDTATDVEPSWSPDGEKIAFRSDRNGADQIFVMSADGSDQVNVTTLGDDFAPCWSPDAEKIAFGRDVGTNFEIFVIDADGSNARRLTNNATDDFSPCFSPDGEHIVYFNASLPNEDIHVMDADGSNDRNITNSPTVLDFDPNWQPREVEGDVTVTKWVNGTPAPGTTFQVTIDCDGEQDDKVLTFGETGGTQSFERESFGPLECTIAETGAGGATTVEITCVDGENAECTGPDTFELFDDPGGDDTHIELSVTNWFPVAAEPTFTG